MKNYTLLLVLAIFLSCNSDDDSDDGCNCTLFEPTQTEFCQVSAEGLLDEWEFFSEEQQRRIIEEQREKCGN